MTSEETAKEIWDQLVGAGIRAQGHGVDARLWNVGVLGFAVVQIFKCAPDREEAFRALQQGIVGGLRCCDIEAAMEFQPETVN